MRGLQPGQEEQVLAECLMTIVTRLLLTSVEGVTAVPCGSRVSTVEYSLEECLNRCINRRNFFRILLCLTYSQTLR